EGAGRGSDRWIGAGGGGGAGVGRARGHRVRPAGERGVRRAGRRPGGGRRRHRPGRRRSRCRRTGRGGRGAGDRREPAARAAARPGRHSAGRAVPRHRDGGDGDARARGAQAGGAVVLRRRGHPRPAAVVLAAGLRAPAEAADRRPRGAGTAGPEQRPRLDARAAGLPDRRRRGSHRLHRRIDPGDEGLPSRRRRGPRSPGGGVRRRPVLRQRVRCGAGPRL
ncbi:MAG: hypothetical protein AVDCRST_MAG57-513, partial [uncultured Blastococcus sp.]